MLRPVLHRPICPTLWSRVIALALLLVVGWSSVEVLWAEEEPAAATAIATAGEDPASEEDCPCFCACACQAVHVVLPTSELVAPSRINCARETTPSAVAPPQRSSDPPYRPPRTHA